MERTLSISEEIEKTLSLGEKRETVLNSNLDDVKKIHLLLDDCKKYGTLPFSNLARCGFVGSIFLKSLLEKDIIAVSEYDDFFKSIHTVAKEFMDDFSLLTQKQLSKDIFLDRYGHLRPGTYDITSKSYKNGFDDYLDFNSKLNDSSEPSIFNFSKETKDKINEEHPSIQKELTDVLNQWARNLIQNTQIHNEYDADNNETIHIGEV